MWKRLRPVGLLPGLALAASVWLSSACGSDGAQPSSTLPHQSVVLESISPSSGALGTEVTIRGSGFTSVGDDVAFTLDTLKNLAHSI